MQIPCPHPRIPPYTITAHVTLFAHFQFPSLIRTPCLLIIRIPMLPMSLAPAHQDATIRTGQLMLPLICWQQHTANDAHMQEDKREIKCKVRHPACCMSASTSLHIVELIIPSLAHDRIMHAHIVKSCICTPYRMGLHCIHIMFLSLTWTHTTGSAQPQFIVTVPTC